MTLIFTDGGYGLIRWKQEERYGDSFSVDFTNPDFVKYAESMHLKGYRVEHTEDLPRILREAFRQNVPSIIECPVDYSANTELTEYLKNLNV